MERIEAVAHTWGGHLFPDPMDAGPEAAKKCPWEPRTAASSCFTKQPCFLRGCLGWGREGKRVPALALLLSVLLCCCLCLFL